MFVGVCRLSFQLPGVHSLKEKRSIVQRLVERTRSKFSVSMAEVRDNDVHQRAQLGFSVVGNETRHVNAMLATISSFVENMGLATLVSKETEVVSFQDEFGDRVASLNGEVPLMTEEDFYER